MCIIVMLVHDFFVTPAQVTLIISGARGPPAPSFADFADAVQQEFDVWWAQELQEAQSPKDVFKPENILASNLTSIWRLFMLAAVWCFFHLALDERRGQNFAPMQQLFPPCRVGC